MSIDNDVCLKGDPVTNYELVEQVSWFNSKQGRTGLLHLMLKYKILHSKMFFYLFCSLSRYFNR